jgi:hypothetical protein
MPAHPAHEPDHPPRHCKRRPQGLQRLTRPRIDSRARVSRTRRSGATSTFHKSARHARLRGRPAVARGRLPTGLLGTRARGIQAAGIRPAATGTSRTPPRCSSGGSSRFPAAGSLTSARLQEPHSSCVRCRHPGGSGITGGTVVDGQAHRDYRRWRFARRCQDPFRHQDGRGPPSPARPPAPSGGPASGLSSCTVTRRRFGLIVAWWELDILCHRLLRADLGTVDLRSLVTARAPSGCWRAEAAIRKAADGGE